MGAWLPGLNLVARVVSSEFWQTAVLVGFGLRVFAGLGFWGGSVRGETPRAQPETIPTWLEWTLLRAWRGLYCVAVGGVAVLDEQRKDSDLHRRAELASWTLAI